MESENLDLLAASLRADSSDTRALLEALAAKFEQALPNATTVERKPTRLLSNAKRVQRLTIKLGDDTYTLSIADETAKPERRKTVGGIAIRSDELPLDEWLNTLIAALKAESGRSEAARVALERLLG